MQGVLPALCSGMLEQDVSHRHAWEALRVHFVVDSHELSRGMACGSRQVQELQHELELCHKENNDLRCQVRRYHNEVDNMCWQEYEDRHDSYNYRKQCHTSTEVTLSSSGGYVWRWQQQGVAACEGLRYPGTEHTWGATY